MTPHRHTQPSTSPPSIRELVSCDPFFDHHREEQRARQVRPRPQEKRVEEAPEGKGN